MKKNVATLFPENSDEKKISDVDNVTSCDPITREKEDKAETDAKDQQKKREEALYSSGRKRED